MGNLVDMEAELDVVEHNGEKLFRYVTPKETEVLFKCLLPFLQMYYRKLSVTRDGKEIGDTMAHSVGTHCPLDIFDVGGLKDVFKAQAVPDDREWVRQLLARDFQVGDKLNFLFAGAPGSSFADILKNASLFSGIVSPSAEAGLQITPA